MSDRLREADLIHLLETLQEGVDHLYLLGDVFEDFIEYRHVIPKGFARLQGLLAKWTDAGIPITYLVGNHDPWHIDYFERELGVTIAFDDLTVVHQGCRIFLSHGDRVALSPMKSWLKGWMRHPVPVWLYRHLMPADVGISLARFVSSTFGTRTIDRDLVDRLRVRARRILADSAADVVVFGHCHFPELTFWPEGRYLNPGYWHESRMFGRLVDGELELMRWNGQTASIVED